MLDVVARYNEAKKAIYNHIGFQEDWVVFAIDDRTDSFWKLDGDAFSGFSVTYHPDKDALNTDGDFYQDEVISHRFYEKSIYEGAELTLMLVDTHTDRNRFFALYKNAMRIDIAPTQACT